MPFSVARCHRVVCAQRTALLLAALVLSCSAYFFQGGGWNQNAHFATTVALVEHQTFSLRHYRHSSGDMARAGDDIVSAKPAATALAMVPGYVVARILTRGIENPGNRHTLSAYITTVLGPGLALALTAVVLLVLLRRRLAERDAVLLSLAMTIATPLWPFSTMTNSTPFVALWALCAYSLLEAPRLGCASLTRHRLFAAGLATTLPATFEYQTAIIAIPLALYAAWQVGPKPRLAFYGVGVATALILPVVHHTVVFGAPWKVGYTSLVMQGFAHDAARGWMGFDGFSLVRLYDLTLGDIRGFFFASPFLLAAVPGLVRMLKDPQHRAEGLAVGSAAWLMLCAVSSLAYWHSGWAIVSRYATLFIPFCAVPVAFIYTAHRRWINLGIAIAFVFMLIAISTTPTPPPPGNRPAQLTVYGWLYDKLMADEVAFRNEHVLVETDLGDGKPTWGTSFNLGEALGLEGRWSLLPFALFLSIGLIALWWTTRRPSPYGW